MIVGFSQFLASNRRISSFLTSDSDSACRNPPLAHLQTPGNLQKPGSKLNSVFCYFVLFFVLFSMVLVVLVVVLVLLGVVLVIIEVVASHHCYYD